MARRGLAKTVELQAKQSKSELAEHIFGLKGPAVLSAKRGSSSRDNAWVALKYFDAGFECFSAWQPDELRDFTKFIGKLSQCTWDTIHKHDGLKMKPIDIKTVRAGGAHLQKVLDSVSKDLTLFELRVTQEMRVHGFRLLDAFFLVLLDRGHRIYRG